jgi:hypothetical protein
VRLSRPAMLFVAAVVVAAAAVIARIPVNRLSHSPELLAPLLLAGFVAGVVRVRIPHHGTHMSAADAFVLCAIAALGPVDACLVAGATVGGAALAPGRGLKGTQLLFGFAAVLLSVAAAAGAFAVAGGSTGAGAYRHLLPLAAAAMVYFLVNTGLVAGVLAPVRRAPLRSTWNRVFGWTAPAYLGGYAMAVAMLAALDAGVLCGIAFGIVPSLLILAFFRSHAEADETWPDHRSA